MLWPTGKTMPKRSSKRRDANVQAFNIVAQAVGDAPPAKAPSDESEKNPAAVALGRLGGLKGGKARAESLSAKKRSEIAKKAALSRWARNRRGEG
jgi:hypothetical protein